WVLWGLAGVFCSIGIGTLTRRTGQEIGRLSAAGTEEARLQGLRRRLSVPAGLNIALLLSTVWAMVAKPALCWAAPATDAAAADAPGRRSRSQRLAAAGVHAGGHRRS